MEELGDEVLLVTIVLDRTECWEVDDFDETPPDILLDATHDSRWPIMGATSVRWLYRSRRTHAAKPAPPVFRPEPSPE